MFAAANRLLFFVTQKIQDINGAQTVMKLMNRSINNHYKNIFPQFLTQNSEITQ